MDHFWVAATTGILYALAPAWWPGAVFGTAILLRRQLGQLLRRVVLRRGELELTLGTDQEQAVDSLKNLQTNPANATASTEADRAITDGDDFGELKRLREERDRALSASAFSLTFLHMYRSQWETLRFLVTKGGKASESEIVPYYLNARNAGYTAAFGDWMRFLVELGLVKREGNVERPEDDRVVSITAKGREFLVYCVQNNLTAERLSW